MSIELWLLQAVCVIINLYAICVAVREKEDEGA